MAAARHDLPITPLKIWTQVGTHGGDDRIRQRNDWRQPSTSDMASNGDRPGSDFERGIQRHQSNVVADRFKIAFASNRSGNFEIWTMNVDGTGAVNLTNNGRSNFDLAWSPDGTKLAFRSDGEIYVVNADGLGQTRLTDPTDGYVDLLPAWSPDGTRIGFAGFAGEGSRDLFVMSADGSGRTNITNTEAREEYYFAWSPGFAEDTDPTWRGDGAELALNSGSKIVRVSVDTSSGTPTFGSRQVVFDATPDGEASPHHPTYSPDDAVIAFDLADDIWRVPAAGGTATQVTSGLALVVGQLVADGRRRTNRLPASGGVRSGMFL